MKKFLSIALLTLFAASAAYGQADEAIVTGTIYDENDQPVPYASVAVYDSTETNVVTGTSSDSSGTFRIDVDPGSYVLKITFLSFKPYTEPFRVASGETEDLGDITLNPTAESLGEVVVEGERSQMTMSFDRRVFDVGRDITSLGGSAINVLDNVPSITTDIDGNISLRGNESVRVLINGKPSSMVSNGVDALRSIPANMIAEVEIITNPSSKYSAEGTAGIINIILKEDKRLGLNGSVSLGTGWPQDHEVSANVNYRRGMINWFLGGSLDYRKDPEEGSSFQRFAGADTSYMYAEQTDADESEIDGNLRFGANFNFSENSVLTASVFANLEEEENREDILYTDLNYVPNGQNIGDGNIITRTDRNSVEINDEKDLDFNLDYQNEFDGDEHKLEADASFDISREKANADIEESIRQGSGDPLIQRSVDEEEEKDLRFNADYVRPLGENGKLEAGLRSDTEWMENSFLAEEQQPDGSWQAVEGEFNDNFLYREGVYAAYTNLGTEWGKFSGQIGVRLENTRIRTELSSTDEVNDQNYVNLFPTAFLNYSFNEEQSVQFSYSRRLRRPWSRMLLPFSDFSDSRTRFTGNPNLKPEFSNSYEAGYLHYWETGSLLTSFYYRHRTDVIERITEQEENQIRIYPINLATEKAWGVEFSADQDIMDGLTLTANANLFRSKSEGTYQNQVFDSEGETLTARSRLRWEISEQLNYQASLRYRGPRNTTQGRREGSTMMDSGLSYEMMEGKALLSLSVRDIFNSRNFNNTVTDDGNPNTDFYSHREFSWSTRSFSINFRYFFGNTEDRRRGGGGGGPGGGGDDMGGDF
ncbi:TonB-dependent receptor [Fodinibius sediminis]|uniref:Outer membrane receptor proteins, mostly Fe transport n=1 Tax=Fodinibius sediminis TaxID=1214077 RepID=A0A521BIH9_9BACT|nr:TonB-dependent receptor [Fodinibius sediminis]SMO46895.1 Outer membrane receptor proteins, mostly Fe transport [Fodinibius sediminis]